MEDKYHITMNSHVAKEMEEVCNYSEAVIMRGIEIGEQRGIEQTLLAALKNMVHNLGFSKESAMDAVCVPPEERDKYAAMI